MASRAKMKSRSDSRLRYCAVKGFIVSAWSASAAQVEQVMLDERQALPHRRGQVLGEEHAERAVEFVDLADRRNAGGVLGDARAVAQTGGAGVAGTGDDPR